MSDTNVSIQDVAKAAGVTKSTVSNVFSGHAYVSPTLTDKVLAAAKALDYTPGFFATGLSGKKDNGIIGLFLESRNNVYLNYFDTLVGAVLREASIAKKKVLIFIGLSNEEFLNCLKAKSTPISGAILVNPTFDDARIKQLQKDELACVTIGKPMFPRPQLLRYVDVDNQGLVVDIARMMKKEGYRKIALLHVDENMTLGFIQRKAFCSVLNESERLLFPMYVGDARDGFLNSKIAIQQGATAIICATPDSARGAYQAIKETGKKVGKDIAVFSLGPFSNEEKPLCPSLSYASQNYKELGQTAAKMLIGMLEKKKTENHLIIKNEITFGASFLLSK